MVLSVVSLCGYAPPASSQDSNERNSDEHSFKGIVAPELCKKNVVSELHCLELEAQKDIAAAAAAEADVQVRGDEIKITETKLYAPFAGVMSRPTVAEGAHLSEQTSMATISELDPILIKAYVPYQVYAEQLQLMEPSDFQLGQSIRQY